jgi:hypothetical protein
MPTRFDPRELAFAVFLAAACGGLVYVFFFTH